MGVGIGGHLRTHSQTRPLKMRASGSRCRSRRSPSASLLVLQMPVVSDMGRGRELGMDGACARASPHRIRLSFVACPDSGFVIFWCRPDLSCDIATVYVF